jgi:hypothetical protein
LLVFEELAFWKQVEPARCLWKVVEVGNLVVETGMNLVFEGGRIVGGREGKGTEDEVGFEVVGF